MGRLYTIDGKLLTDTPEIRLGDRLYPVDDRQKTVKKMTEMMEKSENDVAAMDECLKLLLGAKAFQEVDAMNIPFKAYKQLIETVIAAASGEEPEEISARFQKDEPKE